MSSTNTASKANDVTAAKVHIACVVPLPIIREPSFKSELHIPIVPTNKSKRLSPHVHNDGTVSDSNRRSPTLHGEGSLVARLSRRRLSKDPIRLNTRVSTESLNVRGGHEDTLSLKSFREGALSPFVVMSPVWFRKKYAERQESQRRQVACKDLGGSDCEGWLWKKHEGSGHKAKKWVIRWFELDRKKLRYFKHEDDTEPLGMIHLPGLKISPAPEMKHKKFAFKAHHSGTTFFFAAENQEDMVKWMNKMGLASLQDLDLSRNSTTAGFLRPDAHIHLDVDDATDETSSRSDSDADSIDSLDSRLSSRPNSQRSSFASSREDIVDFYNKLYKANIGIDGSNIKDKRSTAFFSSIGQTEAEKTAYQRLLTLRRTLLEKEEELAAIDKLFQNDSVRSEDLELFRKTYPLFVKELEEDKNAGKRESQTADFHNGPSELESAESREKPDFMSSPRLSLDSAFRLMTKSEDRLDTFPLSNQFF